MDILQERPSQRLHHRISVPLLLDIEGESFRAADWSLGGGRIDDWNGRDMPDVFQLTVRLPFQGFNIAFSCHAQTIRSSDSLAFTWHELSERAQDILETFVEEVITGRITASGDILTRIDTPVTPISTKPDPNPLSTVPLWRLPLIRIAYGLFYGTLGVAIATACALLIWVNMFRLEVTTAVVSAPVYGLRSPVDAMVDWVSDQRDFLAGDIIMRLRDTDLEWQLKQLTIREKRAFADLAQAQNSLQISNDTYEKAQGVIRHQTQLDTERAATLRKRLEAARDYQTTQEALLAKGYTTRTKLTDAQNAVTLLEGQLRSVLRTIDEQRGRLRAAQGTPLYVDGKFIGDATDRAALVKRLEQEIAFVQDERQALQERYIDLNIRAPAPGRLVQGLRGQIVVPGTFVKQGASLALYEQTDAQFVDAFLSQDDIDNISLGRPATVIFPSLDITAAGRVVQVDRMIGFIDEVAQHYTWRGRENKTARVRIAFDVVDKTLGIDQIRPGLPSTVVFERNRYSVWWAQLMSVWHTSPRPEPVPLSPDIEQASKW